VQTNGGELCDLVRCVCSQSVRSRSVWRDAGCVHIQLTLGITESTSSVQFSSVSVLWTRLNAADPHGSSVNILAPSGSSQSCSASAVAVRLFARLFQADRSCSYDSIPDCDFFIDAVIYRRSDSNDCSDSPHGAVNQETGAGRQTDWLGVVKSIKSNQIWL